MQHFQENETRDSDFETHDGTKNCFTLSVEASFRNYVLPLQTDTTQEKKVKFPFKGQPSN